MSEIEKLRPYKKHITRRAFLKTCGVLGLGTIAGGVIQSKYHVIPLDHNLQRISQTRSAMGTFVTVTAVSISVAQTEQAIGIAFEEMDRLIAIFNRHDVATPLSLLNRDSAITAPPPELVAVINHAKQFNLLTHGAFDPTVKPLLDLFDEGFSQSVEAPLTFYKKWASALCNYCRRLHHAYPFLYAIP